jgi:hypothetical protein
MSILYTSVVFPWSSWAMMAMFRIARFEFDMVVMN